MLNERLVEVANAFDRDEFYVVEKFFYKILKAHTMLIFKRNTHMETHPILLTRLNGFIKSNSTCILIKYYKYMNLGTHYLAHKYR